MKDGGTQNARQAKNRRRQQFILRGLQLKVAFQTLFVALPMLLLNFLLAHNEVVRYLRKAAVPGDTGFLDVSSIIFSNFLITLAITIPFALGVGILYSFRFCGPIFKFNKHLTELNKGRWDRTCTLRQGDQLQDFKETLNNALRLLSGRIYSQHELLREAQTVLEDPAASEEKVKELIQKIEAERAEVGPRFGEEEQVNEATPEQPTQEPVQQTN
jgi:hypothetical protein